MTVPNAKPEGARLIYLTGASGSGKDTLLRLLRASLAADDRIWIAQRTITRISGPDEASIPVTEDQFEQLSAAGRFCLQWGSHGLRYGIGSDQIDRRIEAGFVVIVNGSRRYLAEAFKRYPAMTSAEVVVDPSVLGERLRARGRENESQIAERLAAAVLPADSGVPAGARALRLDNNREPDAAAQELLAFARGLLAASQR
jgi:ribose 1,5-bisphosphokinase